MFLAWRTQLREAQQACEVGRLEDAARQLSEHNLRQYKPGEELARQLAAAYIQRAARRGEEQNYAGAWHDLQQARDLAGQSDAWLRTERRIALLALTSVEPALCSGEFATAIRKLGDLKTVLPTDIVRDSQEAARNVESAHNLARRGKLAEADEQLQAALRLRPEWSSLVARRAELKSQQSQLRQQSEALHKAMLEKQWNEALLLADQLLALAPDYRLAREAKQKAWAQAGANMTDSRPHAETQYWPHQVVRTAALQLATPRETAGTRFLLWVDAVGGYLVCLADEIWLGQAGAGNDIAVPILAELSRKHAKLRRVEGGYVLEGVHPVSMDGKLLTGKRLLTDGDEFELGRGVRLRFRQPHALSATARLEFVSRHRTQPGCNAILLMAESCVLGKQWQDHVLCRDWEHEVILFRQGDDLFCRTAEPMEIDGVSVDGRGRLHPNSRVVGSDFSFSLELITTNAERNC